MNEDPWSVLHVITNHEKKVAQQLAVRSLEHYLPLYSERSRWTDRTVTLERPLFPGYVFVRYSPETRVSLIAVPGALRLLGTERSETVQGAEIERIPYCAGEWICTQASFSRFSGNTSENQSWNI